MKPYVATTPLFAVAASTVLASLSMAHAADLSKPLLLKPQGREVLLALAEDELAGKSVNGEDTILGVVKGQALQQAQQRRLRLGNWATTALVLYPVGEKHVAENRYLLTNEVLVEFKPGTDIPAVAKLTGAGKWQVPVYAKNLAILTYTTSVDQPLQAAEQLRKLPGVLWADAMLAKKQSKRSVPNDPYFAYNSANAGYQWHLKNTGENGGLAGLDVNVTGAWDTWRGAGVQIGIIDDGVDLAHPDLVPNLNTSIDYDWNGLDDTPAAGAGDDHGNACAGVAAARGNNAIGVSGAAPEASIVGLRLIAGAVSDSQEAAAMTHEWAAIQIKSNSWGPFDSGQIAEAPGPLTEAALASAATSGRSGLGSLIFWAGGNGRGAADDSNYDGYSNSIYVISVGATGDKGRVASYSERGANLAISAPSSGNGQGISTTDLVGSAGYNAGGGGNYTDANYTNDFGGTSSATPLAAGCAALLLQSKPTLGWRDVKEILIRTATKQDSTEAKWFYNGDGIRFNDDYGAGLINVSNAIALAANWTNLPSMETRSFPRTGLAQALPAGASSGVTLDFVVPAGDNLRVESITLNTSITHAKRGDLRFELTSPSGATSTLADYRTSDNSAFSTWKFSTPQFWGERSVGTWQLRIRNRAAGISGMLSSATLDVFGTAVSSPAPAPVLTGTRRFKFYSNTAIATTLRASNDPTNWVAGTLPAGLALDASTGNLTGTPTGPAATYSVPITVSSSAGSTVSNIEITLIGVDPLLSDALDLPTNTASSEGEALWTRVTSTTHDGVDAAASGSIADLQSSALNSQMTGPGELRFWWKVSSEADYDFLKFYLNGVEMRSISGNVDWAEVSIQVPAGNHLLTWTYRKDSGVAGNLDTAWVDEVRLILPTTVPVITSATTANVFATAALSYQITATQSPQSYAASNLPSGLSINQNTGLISGSVATPGSYVINFSVQNAIGTTAGTLTLTVSAGLTLADAIDAPSFTVTTGGNAWAGQVSLTHDGVDAAKSGAMGNNQSSSLSLAMSGQLELTFWWRVSSEQDYDYLYLFIDGVELAKISGNSGWQQITRPITGLGSHSVEWRYTKDAGLAVAEDAGFVDEVSLLPSSGIPVLTSATVTGIIGKPFTHQILATQIPSNYAASGLPAGLSVNATTGAIEGTPMTTGSYPVTLTASNTFGSASGMLTLTISSFSEPIQAALESPALYFSRSEWFSQTNTTHDAVDALQSGHITDSQSTSLTVNATGPGLVSFWWKVDSEQGYDYLRLRVDGNSVQSISGSAGWTQVNYSLAAGNHVLSWVYSKDSSEALGLDAGWIDQLVLPAPTYADTDGDGYAAHVEQWFGTQSNLATSSPRPTFLSPFTGTLDFPSLSGNDYLVWTSKDLFHWQAQLVPSTGNRTSYTPPADQRTYFRITPP